jgi:putative aldouronate transport system substrate-binding protein
MVNLRKAALIACVFAITLALVGCSKKSTEAQSGPAGGFNATGMPIVKEPVEMTALTMRWGDMGDTFTKNQWLVDLEKRSNIKIKWQVVSSNDWTEQKAILLASGKLPDLIIGNQTFNDADIINNREYFRPLDDLIDNYMPNYKRAMQQLPALRKETVFPDGKIYSLAKNMPTRPKTRNHVIINKTWLDRLGLKVPTNIDEFTAVLRAFKTRDANGNGNPNDEFPISAQGDIPIDMLNPFGITDIYQVLMTVKDGKVFFYPTSDEYKNAIKWVRSLWMEGIIDPETFTQNWNMFNGKRQNATIPLVGVAFEWTHDAAFGQWSDQYIAIPPLAGPDGKRYAGGDPNGIFNLQRNEAEITTFCKYPEAAARWLDEFYDNEATIQNFWGAIGTVISKNADGTYTLNNPPPGTSADAWYWAESLRDFGPGYVEASFNEKIKLSPTSGDGLKWETAKESDPYVMDTYPSVILTREETEELSTLATDIGAYVLQMLAKWVTQGGIDADWDAYLRQLDAMGLQRFIQIRMDAYNRFKK